MSQSIELNLTEGESALLQSPAEALGVAPQQLAHTTLIDALTRLRGDEEFVSVVRRVMQKNSELYERLS